MEFFLSNRECGESFLEFRALHEMEKQHKAVTVDIKCSPLIVYHCRHVKKIEKEGKRRKQKGMKICREYRKIEFRSVENY